MAINLPDTALTSRVERTYVMQFNTPSNAEYSLTIFRETLGEVDGVMRRESTKKGYNEPLSKLIPRVATDDFYAACKSAPTKMHLIGVMAKWCDDLCAEIAAEIAEQAANDAAAPPPEEPPPEE
jgi:hypothetical protein